MSIAFAPASGAARIASTARAAAVSSDCLDSGGVGLRQQTAATASGRMTVSNNALAAGHALVASGRDSSAVSSAVGPSNDRLAVKLDVTKRADAESGYVGLRRG